MSSVRAPLAFIGHPARVGDGAREDRRRFLRHVVADVRRFARHPDEKRLRHSLNVSGGPVHFGVGYRLDAFLRAIVRSPFGQRSR